MIEQIIKLQRVTMEDADILLQWRNDPETIDASLQSSAVERSEHMKWLQKSLESSERIIWIARESVGPEEALGMLRIDKMDEVTWELSWTVSPDKRGKGFGKKIVSRAVNEATSNLGIKKLCARVKKKNIPSIRIAEACGFKLQRELDDVLFFELSI